MTFGAPLRDLSPEDLTRSESVVQIGVPPGRIDILTSISGVAFDVAWSRSIRVPIENLSVPVLGREDFVVNKRASGRPKDLIDIELLRDQSSGHDEV